MYKILNNTTEHLYSFNFWDFSEVRDPVPLRHFGKQEVLAKIDLMEDRFDAPMLFDATRLTPMPFMPGQGRGAWGPEVAVSGEARGHRWVTSTPSLMADMFGFASEEEMEEMKAYLWRHGNYQLEQVGELKFILHDLLND